MTSRFEGSKSDDQRQARDYRRRPRRTGPSGARKHAGAVAGSRSKLADVGAAGHIESHSVARGPAVWLQDALTIRPLTGRSELPQGWASVFGQNSRPELHSDWPDVAEVRALLEDQLGRTQSLLREHADMILTKANAVPPSGGWPLLPGMFHGWHDEARHQGEMYLLHKLHRVR
jgi:hypothetical protein